MATPDAGSPETPSSPRRRPVRLWPLLLLPLAGMCVGSLIAFAGHPAVDPRTGFGMVVAGLYGLVAGSALMTVAALGFLFARVAVRRFTIRSGLIGIALVALLLGLVRGCMP